MTDLSAADGGLALGPGGRQQRRLVALVALVAIADWLFYRHPVGISAVAFLLALGLAVILANPVRSSGREMGRAIAVFAAAVLPLVVAPGLLPVLFGALGAAYLAVAATQGGTGWPARIAASAALILDGSWQAAADVHRAGSAWLRGERASLRTEALLVWVLPLGLGGVFLLLFAAANPVIEAWLAAIDLGALFTGDVLARLCFWLVALALAWPFLFARGRSWLQARLATAFGRAWVGTPASGRTTTMLGTAAILRSLILFNALFAVESALDITYLWGGVALPDGISYAAYAHRGAYPLVATALLAALFVIAVLRPGSDAARSPLIRNLVFLWVGQNVLLVISSILRLDLYVEIYSLTHLRAAAFIWMLLVAIGLVLIVARIVLARSNGWLIGMNAASLGLTLYLSCFVNFAEAIATYNVLHSRELSGRGAWLDEVYLVDLGPQAIPAIDHYLAHRPTQYRPSLLRVRDELAAAHLDRLRDWRAWSLRDWRLAQYLWQSGEPTGTAE